MAAVLRARAECRVAMRGSPPNHRTRRCRAQASTLSARSTDLGSEGMRTTAAQTQWWLMRMVLATAQNSPRQVAAQADTAASARGLPGPRAASRGGLSHRGGYLLGESREMSGRVTEASHRHITLAGCQSTSKWAPASHCWQASWWPRCGAARRLLQSPRRLFPILLGDDDELRGLRLDPPEQFFVDDDTHVAHPAERELERLAQEVPSRRLDA